MNTTQIGRDAENLAAEHLVKMHNMKIINQNWRTRKCEIDIVAQTKTGLIKPEKIVHFVEVKFRKNDKQGSGLEYITKKKLRQMIFAARTWVNENNWEGNYQIDALSVMMASEEQEYRFEFIENISL